MKKALLLLILAVLCVPLHSHETEYDFRSLKLGITLKEFKDSEVIKPKPKRELAKYPYQIDMDIGSTLVCSDSIDTISKPYVSPAEKNAGVISCDYRHLRKYLPTQRYSGSIAPIQVAESLSEFYHFKFVKMLDDEQQRLSSIYFSIPSDSFQTVLDGLIMKFGRPTQTKKEMVQNRIGVQFEDMTALWENESGFILLKKYGADLQKGSLWYELKKYSSYMKKFEDDAKSKTESKM